MRKEKIKDISIASINGSNLMVGYADGDVVIIDNVKELTAISPMRPHYNFIILCCRGHIQLDINGRPLKMAENEVLFSSPNVILDNFMFSPDFECKILCLSDRIIQELLSLNIETWNRAVYVRRMNVVCLPDEDVEQFGLYYALLRQKMQSGERRFSKDSMQALITAMLLDLCAILDANLQQPVSERPSQGRILFERFLALISAQEVKRKAVGYYANELAVTPKYLTMVCETYSGKPASEWINQYVVEDVRHALKNTSRSMKEIAAQLGFSNISHFGSYVRRYFGMSPTKVRSEERKR